MPPPAHACSVCVCVCVCNILSFEVLSVMKTKVLSEEEEGECVPLPRPPDEESLFTLSCSEQRPLLIRSRTNVGK